MRVPCEIMKWDTSQYNGILFSWMDDQAKEFQQCYFSAETDIISTLAVFNFTQLVHTLQFGYFDDQYIRSTVSPMNRLVFSVTMHAHMKSGIQRSCKLVKVQAVHTTIIQFQLVPNIAFVAGKHIIISIPQCAQHTSTKS